MNALWDAALVRFQSVSDEVLLLTKAVEAWMWAILVPVAFVVIAVARRSYVGRRRRQQQPPFPPGPPPHWLLGNLPDLPDPSKSSLDAKLLEWTEQYGLYFTMSIPLLGRVIVISDPALLKRVTVTKNRPKSPSYDVFKTVVGSRSMLLLSGQEWAVHRKGFNPGFATSFIKETVPIMADKLRRFVAAIDGDSDAGVDTSLLLAAQTFASDVIASLAFGEDWGGGTVPHPARVYLNEMTLLLEGILLKPVQKMLGLVGLGPMRQIQQYSVLLDKEMRAILERRLKNAAAGPAEATNNSKSAKDICSLAIKTMQGDRPAGQLTEEDKASIVDQLKTFYFAGHDTTSTLITWAMWLLSQNPTELDRIRQELQEHGIWNKGSTDDEAISNPPTYEDLQKCTYLEAVLKETLRLYPPAGIVSRWGDDPNETYEGYQIGGTIQMLAIYTMHRNPKLWKNPEAFRPDRFLDGSEDGLADKFVPFSRGPRDCIGRHFAMLEAKLAVSCLASRYDLQCVNPNENVAARMTYVPRFGGYVKFIRRSK